MFLYHFFWTLLSVFCIPIVLLTRTKRLAERLALHLPRVRLGRGNIWIHALSVGEVVSAVPLVENLRRKCPQKDIVFSVTTTKGMDIARAQLEGKVKVLFFMPVDFWWCVRRIVRYVKPSVFVLVETDIWPGLIYHMKKRGIRSVLVNGRISPGTFRSYKRFPFFTRMMFRSLEACLMQSDLDKTRLLKVGLDPEKVGVAGNIKFDRHWAPMGQEEHQEWLRLLGLGSNDLVWVAGSTHPGEEEYLLEVFKRLRPSFGALRLVIAPRKVERAGEILRLGSGMGIKTSLRTDLKSIEVPYDVLVLDTLGELGRIYGLGKVCFVGGSLVPFGGHNLLEPASFGCPVLFGPHTHNFVHMSESLLEAGGGWRVRNKGELHDAMKRLLNDAGFLSPMGIRAKEFVESNRGALERVMRSIGDLM